MQEYYKNIVLKPTTLSINNFILYIRYIFIRNVCISFLKNSKDGLWKAIKFPNKYSVFISLIERVKDA